MEYTPRNRRISQPGSFGRVGHAHDALADAREVVTQVTTVDVLEVTCWCEATTVKVARRDVLAGRTGACHRPRCGR